MKRFLKTFLAVRRKLNHIIFIRQSIGERNAESFFIFYDQDCCAHDLILPRLQFSFRLWFDIDLFARRQVQGKRRCFA